jgi:hypothetical protein
VDPGHLQAPAVREPEVHQESSAHPARRLRPDEIKKLQRLATDYAADRADSKAGVRVAWEAVPRSELRGEIGPMLKASTLNPMLPSKSGRTALKRERRRTNVARLVLLTLGAGIGLRRDHGARAFLRAAAAAAAGVLLGRKAAREIAPMASWYMAHGLFDWHAGGFLNDTIWNEGQSHHVFPQLHAELTQWEDNQKNVAAAGQTLQRALLPALGVALAAGAGKSSARKIGGAALAYTLVGQTSRLFLKSADAHRTAHLPSAQRSGSQRRALASGLYESDHVKKHHRSPSEFGKGTHTLLRPGPIGRVLEGRTPWGVTDVKLAMDMAHLLSTGVLPTDWMLDIRRVPSPVLKAIFSDRSLILKLVPNVTWRTMLDMKTRDIPRLVRERVKADPELVPGSLRARVVRHLGDQQGAAN